MTATVWNIVIEQGATWRTTLTLTERDLTGCSARMQVRETAASPSAVLSLTSAPGGGIVITPGPPGVLDITISAAQTADMDWRRGVYDLELESAGGDVDRLLKGDVAVDPEVTR